MKTYYTVLDISKSASDEEIKSAFRRLASRYHPDVNHDPEAGEYFKLINRAYKVLLDPEKRRDYDNLISGGNIYRQKVDEEVVESSGFWPAISNTLAYLLTFGGLAFLLTAGSQWLAESGPLFWNITTVISLASGLMLGILLGFNANFEGREIFGSGFSYYKLSFWLISLAGFGGLIYTNWLVLSKLF